MLKYVKSQRGYGFLITKELIFGFQILDLKDHFSASLNFLSNETKTLFMGAFFGGKFKFLLKRTNKYQFNVKSDHFERIFNSFHLENMVVMATRKGLYLDLKNLTYSCWGKVPKVQEKSLSFPEIFVENHQGRRKTPTRSKTRKPPPPFIL